MAGGAPRIRDYAAVPSTRWRLPPLQCHPPFRT